MKSNNSDVQNFYAAQKFNFRLMYLCMYVCRDTPQYSLGYKLMKEMVENDEIDSRNIALRLSTEKSGFASRLNSAKLNDGKQIHSVFTSHFTVHLQQVKPGLHEPQLPVEKSATLVSSNAVGRRRCALQVSNVARLQENKET